MRSARSLWAPAALAGCLALVAFGCSSSDDNTVGPPPGPGGPAFTSGTLNSGGEVFVFTFPTDGSFAYHCGFHGVGMSGTVVVSAAGADSPSVNVGQGGNFFVPGTVQVKTGGYVKWVWVNGMHSVVR